MTQKESVGLGAWHNQNSYHTDVYETVREIFSNYPNVELIRGKVPDTLNDVQIDKVAYLSIDMNIAFPEIAAMMHFWDKMVVGGVVVLDDYCFGGHEEQQDVFDEFTAELGVKVLTLPTGQGLIIKH